MSYLLFLQEIRNLTGGIFDSVILSLTTLGEAAITWGLLALIYWCVDKRAGQLMALNVSYASTLNQGLKNIFRIERPWVLDGRIQPVEASLSHAGGYSFPSGHTTRGTAVWGAWARQLWKKKEKCLSIICILVCLIVAFTRNYLGVHTPKDVIVALVMGAVLIFALDYALSWAEKGKYRDLALGFVGCIIFLLLMLRVGCLSNAGAGVGILFGWIVERRFIKFNVEGSLGRKVFRFSLGSFLLVILYSVPNVVLGLFMAGKYAGFFSNFLFAFVLMAGYPYVFSRLEKKEKAEKKMIFTIILAAVIVLLCGVGAYKVKQNMLMDEQANQSQEIVGDIVETENTEVVENTEATENVETIEQKQVQVIAHRGYSSEFPENTLAAFKGACEIGVDYIEMDVQATKDGVLVMFHDTDLIRTTGKSGKVSDYTYAELCELDAGSWFRGDFAGEKIPTLEETLAYLQGEECRIYLELKDIGMVEGFAENVAATVSNYGMMERCVFASFNYDYLSIIKNYNANAQILYNTSSDKVATIYEYPAEYYGLYLDSISAEMVNAIHAAGSNVFVWTVDNPKDMLKLIELGVDGICTNQPGLANVAVHPEYRFLAENYENSFNVPGLYEQNLPEIFDTMVVQGFTKTPHNFIITAYSKANANSVLYITNVMGDLVNIVDLGFVAHVGGIAYDPTNDYLWVTGPEGMVYAISCSAVLNGTYAGEILVSFDAGLINHDGAKVASFLTWFENELFVGSWVEGMEGMLNRYTLANPNQPQLAGTAGIPQRIQGATLWRNNSDGNVMLYLSQGYQTLDGALLGYQYSPELVEYAQAITNYYLPEGIEQIQASIHGMYMLFESGVKPYRETARVINDQVYLVRLPR